MSLGRFPRTSMLLSIVTNASLVLFFLSPSLLSQSWLCKTKLRNNSAIDSKRPKPKATEIEQDCPALFESTKNRKLEDGVKVDDGTGALKGVLQGKGKVSEARTQMVSIRTIVERW